MATAFTQDKVQLGSDSVRVVDGADRGRLVGFYSRQCSLYGVKSLNSTERLPQRCPSSSEVRIRTTASVAYSFAPHNVYPRLGGRYSWTIAFVLLSASGSARTLPLVFSNPSREESRDEVLRRAAMRRRRRAAWEGDLARVPESADDACVADALPAASPGTRTSGSGANSRRISYRPRTQVGGRPLLRTPSAGTSAPPRTPRSGLQMSRYREASSKIGRTSSFPSSHGASA